MIKKYRTIEEFEIQVVLGIFIALTIILVLIFQKFFESLFGYSLISDVLIILAFVLLPAGLTFLYYFIKRKEKKYD